MIYGDNYPTYSSLFKILKLRKSRRDMVKKLIKQEELKITENDIIDMQIDLYLYNKKCRKEKIKRIYKKISKKKR